MSELVESNEINDSIEFMAEALDGEVKLRQMIDLWCVDQLGNTNEALEKSESMFIKARDIFYGNHRSELVEVEDMKMKMTSQSLFDIQYKEELVVKIERVMFEFEQSGLSSKTALARIIVGILQPTEPKEVFTVENLQNIMNNRYIHVLPPLADKLNQMAFEAYNNQGESL